MKRLLLSLSLIIPLNVLAAPPPGSNPNSEISKWYRSLEVPGYWNTVIKCCDESDCRTVQARETVGGNWEILVGEEWIFIPPEKIVRDKTHPAGSAVACLRPDNSVRCFTLPGSAG